MTAEEILHYIYGVLHSAGYRSRYAQLLKSDGLVDFMANATASIEVNTLLPQTQLLLAGKTSPSAFATKIQTDYESDLGK